MTPYYNEEEYITISTLNYRLKSEIENRNNELQDVNHDNKERKMNNEKRELPDKYIRSGRTKHIINLIKKNININNTLYLINNDIT